MNDDLLHAQASVDWPVTQLPAFKSRLDAWLNENIQVIVKELPADTPNNFVVAVQKAPLPLAFQVEAGAYVNAIRSSLDILASALANRHCKHLIDDAYFPIVNSAAIFASNHYKGSKFIEALPKRERSIIESLKPYDGGNKLLYPLHLLDIVRKHKRLLSVDILPAKLNIIGVKMKGPFRPFISGWIRSGDDETVIGLLTKGVVPNPQFKLTMQVSLSETTYLEHREIIATLREFASLANSIIKRFDFS
jgi:hypothetical protein